jgi:hypothetical protein
MEVIAENDRDVTKAQREAAVRFIRENYPNTPVFGHGEVNPGHREPDEGMTIINAIRAERAARVVRAAAGDKRAERDAPSPRSTRDHPEGKADGGGGPLSLNNWQAPDRKHAKIRLDNNIGADVAVNMATMA